MIVEASNRIKLSKKTGMPLGVLAGRKQPEPQESESEEEEEYAYIHFVCFIFAN